MARTTVENTIERIRRQLASTVRLEINTLGSTLTDSTTTFPLTYDVANSIRSGAVLSVGRELMRVITVNVSSKEVTVIRGWQDTNAAAHDTGAEVLINPRFTRFDIFDAIVQEIDSWSPDIFRVEDDTDDFPVEATGFEVPTAYVNALGVVSLRRNYTEDASAVWPDMPFKLYRGRSGSLTPTEGTGMYVRFTKGLGYTTQAGAYAIRYALPYDTALIVDEDTDLVGDVGIDSPLLELVELGVKYRLLMDDENPRSGRGVQDEPRRTEEVPPGASMNQTQAVLQRYERRRNSEVLRLRTMHPFRSW
jgi:hypothetical protein